MAKVLVLYYSAYGHIEALAGAIAEGARSAGAHVDIKRVPETVPEAIAKSSHFKLDQAVIAHQDEQSFQFAYFHPVSVSSFNRGLPAFWIVACHGDHPLCRRDSWTIVRAALSARL